MPLPPHGQHAPLPKETTTGPNINPTPTEQAATTIAGQRVVPVINGVSVLGTSVRGTSRVLISGITVAVDKSHIYFGSESYPIPTVNPASTTTLANGVVAFPLSNAVSVIGTALTAGTPAATFSGTVVSLDASSNLIFDGTAQNLPTFARTTSDSSQVTMIDSVAVELLPSGISIAGTALTPAASLITTIGGQIITAVATAIKTGSATMSAGAKATNLGGTVVSLGSGGSLVIGSKTVVLAAPSGSFGGSGPGGPLTNGSSPHGSVPVNVQNNTTSSVHSFEGKAGGFECLIPQALASLVIAMHFLSHL